MKNDLTPVPFSKNRFFTRFRDQRTWLKLCLGVLGVLWGYWASGTWPTHPIMEYVPPRFEQLELAQGTLSFTRQSKSSGGEIEIHFSEGKKLRLACNAPNTLPSACYYLRVNGRSQTRSFESQLTGKMVTVWWMPEKDVADHSADGRVYQMLVGEWMFFKYPEQVAYYAKHYQKGGGRSWFFGGLLLLLSGLVIWAQKIKE